MKIRDLERSNRPRERARRLGLSVLSDAELLALLLSTGTGGENALELSARIINGYGSLNALFASFETSFPDFKGVGEAKALRLAATKEIARRLNQENTLADKPFRAEDAYSLFKDSVGTAESLFVVSLDSRGRLLSYREASKGKELRFDPLGVARILLSTGAKSALVVHTHPGESPFPSSSDIEGTAVLKKKLRDLAVPLKDHVIVSRHAYFSFRDEGIL